MRRAMAEAEVGDDVFGDDPTIRKLETRTAERLGKEAAIFVPSGTMSNQIAIALHTRPGDELICDSRAHVYVWEAGGIARLSGVTSRTITTTDGMLSLSDVEGCIRPNDIHYVRTRLVCLENTHNRAGGRVHPIESVAAISRWAHSNEIAMHLDGARLMNAVVASGRPASEWARHFDTVSICFSKGLGAPVGSALAGSHEHIHQARRLRKLFGGGMRQAGIIAAGALYGLENHVERLRDDHENAQILADAFAGTEGFALESGPVETNLVWVKVDPSLGTPTEVASYLRGHGILVSTPAAGVIRACTHLDVSRQQIAYVADTIRQIEPAMISAMTLVY
jgi:threonine aldolase